MVVQSAAHLNLYSIFDFYITTFAQPVTLLKRLETGLNRLFLDLGMPLS